MKGQLKDLAANALITDVPGTVNLNNQIIANEFDNIFDASNDYLTQSLYAPNGAVKSHWGEFVNLRVSKLIIDNDTTDDTTNIEHADTEHRFSWQLSKMPKLDVSELLDYAHDTKMIVTYADSSNPIYIGASEIDYPITLRTELDAIEEIVGALAKNISVKISDGSVFEDSVEEFYTTVDSSTVDSSSDFYDYDDIIVFEEDMKSTVRNFEERISKLEEISIQNQKLLSSIETTLERLSEKVEKLS